MYHRFSGEKKQDQRFVSSSELREQLRYIRRHHPNWVPDDQMDALTGRKKWESCPVVITIDDGYRDFFDVAFPLFMEFGIRPVLFVTTNFVSGQALLWWDLLKLILNTTRSTSLQLDMNGKAVDFSLTSEKERAEAWNFIADHCRFMPHDRKELLIQELSDRLAVDIEDINNEHCLAATWAEVKMMSESGVVVGAHTLNHPILSRLSYDQAEIEIAGSKKQLEDALEMPVLWFCYPQGGPADFTDETKKIVAQADFRGSYIAYQALDFDMFTLPRYCITGDMLDFFWCLCGAEYLVLKLRQISGRPARLGEAYWRGSEPGE